MQRPVLPLPVMAWAWVAQGCETVAVEPRREIEVSASADGVPVEHSLADRVWGAGFTGDARTVDLHVRRLRAKIEDDASDPHYIETVWGVGYRMSEAAAG